MNFVNDDGDGKIFDDGTLVLHDGTIILTDGTRAKTETDVLEDGTIQFPGQIWLTPWGEVITKQTPVKLINEDLFLIYHPNGSLTGPKDVLIAERASELFQSDKEAYQASKKRIEVSSIAYKKLQKLLPQVVQKNEERRQSLKQCKRDLEITQHQHAESERQWRMRAMIGIATFALLLILLAYSLRRR